MQSEESSEQIEANCSAANQAFGSRLQPLQVAQLRMNLAQFGGSLGGHPRPAIHGHLKTGQRDS